MKNIGILVTATHKYIKFVGPLYDSMEKYFMRGTDHEWKMFVFTDKKINNEKIIKITKIYQKHEDFPAMTIKRFEIYYKSRKLFKDFDYLYALDADMLFVDFVGEEILSDLVSTLQHGLYKDEIYHLPYDRNTESTAYISHDEGSHYFCGAVNGGKSDIFLKMCKEISDKINIDYANGVMALWHDESHLNRYLINNPPTKILDPSYCVHEGSHYSFKIPPSKIVAILKNHKDVR